MSERKRAKIMPVACHVGAQTRQDHASLRPLKTFEKIRVSMSKHIDLTHLDHAAAAQPAKSGRPPGMALTYQIMDGLEPSVRDPRWAPL